MILCIIYQTERKASLWGYKSANIIITLDTFTVKKHISTTLH